MAPPNAIDAPYNFVPLADWVHTPDWAERVSHDLPFRDGLSGHLDLSIKAHTPILVGGRQVGATPDKPGEVYPYQLPDGRYALPGSSLKGMIRSVLEIASFSRMNLVDDVRYGLRDISGGAVSEAYTAKVRDKLKTGFMQLGRNGGPTIIPCQMARLSHRNLEDWLKVSKPIFSADRSVSKKYQKWMSICADKSVDPATMRFSVEDGEAALLGSGSFEGVPVFTGQISDSTKKHGKQRDFVFYDEDESKRFQLSRRDWNDFLFVHGDQAKKDAQDMSWPGHWKSRYWAGEKVPVFYLPDRTKIRVGLAFMPRLAGDFSVKEMIEHTSEAHLGKQENRCRDFVETLFGTVGDKPDECLKGRIRFQHAVTAQSKKPMPSAPTILNGPKGSYFPNYILQRADQATWKLDGKGYATALTTPEHPTPEIRGWKRYPVRQNEGVQALADEQKSNKSVQVVLNPLDAGAVFSGKVYFHNLKHEELGALCWALTWGGGDGFRHGLGMGKSFGFGQLSIDIAKEDIRPNCATQDAPGWRECQDTFVTHMENAAEANKKCWRDSLQIRALLGMANPENAQRFSGRLQHMRLEPKRRVNEFVAAKQARLVLADYPPSAHPPTWAEQEADRQAEDKRLAEQEAERVRLEAEARKKANEQAAYDNLPGEQKLIVDIEKDFKDFCDQSEVEQREGRGAFVGRLNTLEAEAGGWDEHAICMEAAALLTRIYEEIGWTDPGLKKAKRIKQEAKRKQRIAKLCAGSMAGKT